MRADTQLHDVVSMKLTSVKDYTRSDGGAVFYHRILVVTMADGKKESIDLYSNDGYSLLVQDPDIAEMTEPELKAA